MNMSQFEIIMIINATNTQIAVTFFAFFCKFTIDNTKPLAIIFSHQNKRPSLIKGPLLKIRLQDPLNVLRENSSPVHYWCAYGILRGPLKADREVFQECDPSARLRPDLTSHSTCP